MTGYKVFLKSVATGWKADKKSFWITVVNTIVVSSWSFITVASFAQIINIVADSAKTGVLDTHKIALTILFIIFANFVPNISDYYDQYVGDKLFRNISLYVTKKWINKISSLDLGTVEGRSFQDLNQKVSDRGADSISSLNGWFFRNLSDLMKLFASAFIFLAFDYRLAILAILSVLPSYFVEKNAAKNIFYLWNKELEKKKQKKNKLSHFLEPLKLTELKLIGKTFFYSKKLVDLQRDFDTENNKINFKTYKNKLYGECVYIVCFVLSILLIVKLAISGELAVGTMLFVYSSFQTFLYSSASIFRSLGRVREHINFAQEYFSLLAMEPIFSENEGDEFKNEDPVEIVFEKVKFKYPGTDKIVLNNINLTIKPNERIAIVGENGASKTTFIKLLSKMYLPTEGKILVNKIDLHNIKATDWQKNISFMTQDFSTYADSIRDQIAYGSNKNPDQVSLLQVEESAKKAHAYEFIDKLPKKFDHILGRQFKDGVELSKGQKQKIALARFLLRDSKVLILDEPTSAIDAIAESKIFNQLFEEERNRTLLIISHRFNTVKRADKIIVFEQGKIIESGSHEELINRKGKYAEMYNAQAKEYQE